MNLKDYNLLIIALPPLSPINPPTKPPTIAPTNGIGIRLCPTTNPSKLVPKRLAISKVRKPAYWSFFFLFTTLLLKMLYRVIVYPPVITKVPTKGILLTI